MITKEFEHPNVEAIPKNGQHASVVTEHHSPDLWDSVNLTIPAIHDLGLDSICLPANPSFYHELYDCLDDEKRAILYIKLGQIVKAVEILQAEEVLMDEDKTKLNEMIQDFNRLVDQAKPEYEAKYVELIEPIEREIEQNLLEAGELEVTMAEAMARVPKPKPELTQEPLPDEDKVLEVAQEETGLAHSPKESFLESLCEQLARIGLGVLLGISLGLLLHVVRTQQIASWVVLPLVIIGWIIETVGGMAMKGLTRRAAISANQSENEWEKRIFLWAPVAFFLVYGSAEVLVTTFGIFGSMLASTAFQGASSGIQIPWPILAVMSSIAFVPYLVFEAHLGWEAGIRSLDRSRARIELKSRRIEEAEKTENAPTKIEVVVEDEVVPEIEILAKKAESRLKVKKDFLSYLQNKLAEKKKELDSRFDSFFVSEIDIPGLFGGGTCNITFPLYRALKYMNRVVPISLTRQNVLEENLRLATRELKDFCDNCFPPPVPEITRPEPVVQPLQPLPRKGLFARIVNWCKKKLNTGA